MIINVLATSPDPDEKRCKQGWTLARTRSEVSQPSASLPVEACYRIRVDLRAPGAPIVRQALKRSELVALDIVRDITRQRLHPGDMLPLESEMLSQYKISRSSLREALRLLETQGLIHIRTGPRGGTTVGAPSPFYLARSTLPYLQMAGATYGQALEAWAMTEQLLARAAALNPDRMAVEAAMRPFTKDRKSGDASPRSVTEGMGFHDTVALLSANPVLDLMMQSVAHIVSDHILNAMPLPTLAEWMVHDHADLAEAIIDGDADRAADAMAAHARRVIDEYARVAPQKIGEQESWL